MLLPRCIRWGSFANNGTPTTTPLRVTTTAPPTPNQGSSSFSQWLTSRVRAVSHLRHSQLTVLVPTDSSSASTSDEFEVRREKQIKGWTTLMQGAAVVVCHCCISPQSLLTIFYQSTFFAATSAQLLGVIKSDQMEDLSMKHPNFVSLLLSMSYGAVIFNSSATIVSFLLLDQLVPIPICWSPSNWYNGPKDRDKRPRSRRFWDLLFWHCMLWDHCQTSHQLNITLCRDLIPHFGGSMYYFPNLDLCFPSRIGGSKMCRYYGRFLYSCSAQYLLNTWQGLELEVAIGLGSDL